MRHIFMTAFVAVLLMGCSSKDINSNTSKIIDGAKDIVNEGSKAVNSEG
ncbi:MAG: hypothetical protein U9P71_08535 [Campylobacterota bacterium]|nr:hypothetical protein [Campylobacterota bacterium]